MLTKSKSSQTPRTAHEILSALPLPPELLRVQAELAARREQREALRGKLASLATLNSKSAEAAREREMLDIVRQMEAVQQEIIILRQRRSELRQPLVHAVAGELEPLVREAADRIISAVAMLDQSLDALRQAALETAPLSAGGLNGAGPLPFGGEALATLDTRALRPLEYFARRLRGEPVL